MAEGRSLMGVDMTKPIGKYKIEQFLGRGVMSEVFLARAPDNEYWAVKICDPTVAKKLDCAERFHKEIVDPTLMRYWEIHHVDKWEHCFITDRLSGFPANQTSLRRYGQRATIDFFVQAAGSLVTVHEKKILHGNIKPSNIMVRREQKSPVPVIADFGLDYIYNKDYFKSEVFAKTFPYMSPEKIAALVGQSAVPDVKASVSPASDVYSLAAVLCEALTGRCVFGGVESIEEVLEVKKNKKFQVVAVNSPSKKFDVKLLNELVEKALSYDPAKRPQTMKEFADSLRACKVDGKKDSK